MKQTLQFTDNDVKISMTNMLKIRNRENRGEFLQRSEILKCKLILELRNIIFEIKNYLGGLMSW